MERETDDFFRGFGSKRGVFSSLFDDPFFSRPFGSSFGSDIFGQRVASDTSRERPKEKGVLIEELHSGDEGEESEESGEAHSKSSNEPSVEHPDDYIEDTKNNAHVYRSEPFRVEAGKPQSRSNSVHTCKVTYGGVDGAYYTSTRTRREGNGGVVVEETKEADKTTGQAQHRISRGIHDKGHSVTRKLNSDGQVNTSQTLHNLDEDELLGFEEAWNTNKGDFPSLKHGFSGHGNSSLWGSERRDPFSRGLLLPSSNDAQRAKGTESEIGARTKKVIRINID